ncbi:MAG: hypothetical protein GF401_03435 [Chitinivibrionales bacterium]|nr:hypothetical protein [Chitinivibrionales bacterium]
MSQGSVMKRGLWFLIVLFLHYSAVNAAMAEFYVAPNGGDSNDGSEGAPFKTIGRAKTAVASANQNMTGDIIVYLRGGQYYLTETLGFDGNDGGNNGHNVIYHAFPGEVPVISGGVRVTEWTDAGGGIWEASLAIDKKIRHMWVNGVRAEKARSGTKYTGTLGADFLDGCTNTNFHDVELSVYKGWDDHHLCVDDFIGGETQMQEPMWSIATNPPWNQYAPGDGDPFYVWNAYCVLDEPGEFYYNTTDKVLYYMPRSDETPLTDAVVTVGVVEGLVQISGSSLTSKVSNLHFRGITFSHDCYLLEKAGDSYGFTTMQLIPMTIQGGGGETGWCGTGWLQGAVTVDHAQNVVFERCAFRHLGGIGINLTNGVTNCSVRGNIFNDIASTSISVGSPRHAFLDEQCVDCPWDELEAPKNVKVMNNIIRNGSYEIKGSPNFVSFFTDELEFSHNDLGPSPYINVHVGWGWDYALQSTTCKNNKYNANIINGGLQKSPSKDGACMYSLGQMPGSTFDSNFVHFRGVEFLAKGFFSDAGSGGQQWNNNVFEAGDITTPHRWFNNWGHTGEIRVEENWVNYPQQPPYTTKTNYQRFDGPSTTVDTIYFIEGAPEQQPWPDDAQAIIDNAGLLDSYADLMSKIDDHDAPLVTSVTSSKKSVRLPKKSIPVTTVAIQKGARITFETPRQSRVSISIVDMLGREIACLAKGMRKAGRHSVMWNRNDAVLGSGLYLVHLTIDDYRMVRELSVIR